MHNALARCLHWDEELTVLCRNTLWLDSLPAHTQNASKMMNEHTHCTNVPITMYVSSTYLSSLSFGKSTFSGRRGVVELKTLLQPLACWCFRPLSTMYCPAPTGFCGTREGNRQQYTGSMWQHSLCRDCMWQYTVYRLCVCLDMSRINNVDCTTTNIYMHSSQQWIRTLYYGLHAVLTASLIATFTKSLSHMTIVRPPD